MMWSDCWLSLMFFAKKGPKPQKRVDWAEKKMGLQFQVLVYKFKNFTVLHLENVTVLLFEVLSSMGRVFRWQLQAGSLLPLIACSLSYNRLRELRAVTFFKRCILSWFEDLVQLLLQLKLSVSNLKLFDLICQPLLLGLPVLDYRPHLDSTSL